jgi:hypothetical protein
LENTTNNANAITVITETGELIPEISAGPFVVTPVGLQVTDQDVPFEVWEAYGYGLRRVEAAIQWVIGDWLNYGETVYGETYAKALEYWPEYGYQSLNQYKWVASKVQFILRNINLSWSHHYAVARLDPPAQKYWLEQAKKRDWSVSDMRGAMRRNPEGVEDEEEKIIAFSWSKEPVVVAMLDGMQAVDIGVSRLLRAKQDIGVAEYYLAMVDKKLAQIRERIRPVLDNVDE